MMDQFEDCTSILDVVDEITWGLKRHVAGMERVSADRLGLDSRCGRVSIDRDQRVIVSDNSRSLDYYGGFEYIKEGKGRTTIGDHVIYHGTDRVDDCFDILEEETEAA
jgi:hypothetical protein